MAERVRSGYRRLFELRVLHHYWLDEGAATFERLTDQLQARRLLRYDVRQFLTITPSRQTDSAIRGLGGVCRTTGLGLVAAVSGDATVDAGSSFEFFLTPASADLASYTAMTLFPQQVVEVAEPSSGQRLRYKERIPLLSNRTGANRALNGHKRLFLSSEYPVGAGDRIEDLVLFGNRLRQLTSDQPGATFQDLGPVADLPVYLHQGDVPVVGPPQGVVGAPARGIQLSAEMPEQVFAIVRLSPSRADDDDFSFVDGSGHPRPTAPIFEIHLKNRATTWRYLKKGDTSVINDEPQPLPLTYFGNAGTKQKAGIGDVGVERNGGSPAKVTQIVSEIFV